MEVVCLILDAPKLPLRSLRPEWSKVQRKLNDTSFLTKVLSYDIHVLRAAPALVSFLVADYFDAQIYLHSPTSSRTSSKTGSRTSSRPGSRSSSTPGRLRSSSSPNIVAIQHDSQEKLTFARVQRANRAAGALFKWCTEVLTAACLPAEDPEKADTPALEIDMNALEEEPDECPQKLPTPKLACPLSPQNVPARVQPKYNFDYGWKDSAGGKALPVGPTNHVWDKENLQAGNASCSWRKRGPLVHSGFLVASNRISDRGHSTCFRSQFLANSF